MIILSQRYGICIIPHGLYEHDADFTLFLFNPTLETDPHHCTVFSTFHHYASGMFGIAR